MNDEKENNLTVQMLWADILVVLQRRRTLLLLTTVSAVLAAYIGLLFVSDKYEAQARLRITLGRENTEVPVSVERGAVIRDGVNSEEVDSEIAQLTSPPLLLAVVDQVGVSRFGFQPDRSTSPFGHAKYFAKRCVHWVKEGINNVLIGLALRPRLSERELARQAVEKNLDVYREKGSSVINLSLRLPDPVLGQNVLEALIKEYLQKHAEMIGQGSAVLQVFEEQARDYGDRLEELRDQSARLKAQLGVSSVQEQKSQLLEMLKTAELVKQSSDLELAKLKAGQAAVLERLPQLKDQLITSQVVSPSIYQTRVKELLASLRLKKAEAQAKYDADSAPVKKLDEQIAGVETLTTQMPEEDDGPKTYTRNPIVEHMDFQQEDDQIRRAMLEAGVAEASRQITGIKAELKKMDQAETDLQKIQLEISVVETRYLANASKREAARTEEMMNRAQVANVSIVSPPSYSEKPVSPKRLLLMGLALMAGLCGGLCLGLFIEWQSDIIYSARDLERVAPRQYLGSLTTEEKTAAIP